MIRCRIVKSDEFTFYPTLSHQESTLADLVRVAGTRWTIEACFEAAKGETGLDQYEVRSWTGWHRHITFAILAQANLAVMRRAAVGGRGEPRSRGRSPAPHRACCSGCWHGRDRLIRIEFWLGQPWRRRHRQRARRCHWRRRTGGSDAGLQYQGTAASPSSSTTSWDRSSKSWSPVSRAGSKPLCPAIPP